MKMLFDVILTAEPDRCSTNFQFLTFANRLLKERNDVFIYWMVPDWVTDEQLAAIYPQDERVLYITYPQFKDRTREYLTLNSKLDNALAFNGQFWDFDVVVTVRHGLVPLMKLIMTAPRGANIRWLKEIWLIDEMPLMDFKRTVAKFDPDVQDLFCISGYLAADKVWSLGYHEPAEIVARARDFYAPSVVMNLHKKMKAVCTTKFSDFSLLSEDRYFKPGGEKKFCISYVGRMEGANRIKEVDDLMRKTFVLKGDRVRLLVCTQSRVLKVFDQSVIECLQPNREQFWKYAKEDMHVSVMLNIEGGFILSLLELLMFGVPTVVLEAPWSVALLGKNYPLFVKSEIQAYALCKLFYDDYAGMYAKFADWCVNEFRLLFEQRFKTDMLYDLMMHEVDRFSTEIPKRFADNHPGKASTTVTSLIQKYYADKGELVLFDAIKELEEKGELDDLARKLDADDRDHRGLTFSSNWNEFRVALQVFHSWKDASVKTGHLVRSK